MNIQQIIEGWRNNLFPPEEKKKIIEEISAYRMDICDGCDFHSKHHSTPIRPDVHCTKCGCTLAAKTKCLSCNCPENKWQAISIPEENEKE